MMNNDCWKNRDEGDVRTEKDREKDWSLTSLWALIVSDCDDIDWEGVPDIIPDEESIERPSGRDPEVIENDRLSPLIVGEIENDWSLGMTYDDWE